MALDGEHVGEARGRPGKQPAVVGVAELRHQGGRRAREAEAHVIRSRAAGGQITGIQGAKQDAQVEPGPLTADAHVAPHAARVTLAPSGGRAALCTGQDKPTEGARKPPPVGGGGSHENPGTKGRGGPGNARDHTGP